MKKTFFYLFLTAAVISTIAGCHKDIYGCTDPSASNYAPNANVDNGSCKYYGNLMFWTNVNEGNVVITINGSSQTITGYVTGGTPNCGNNVSANFSLPQGSYTYTAVGPASPAYPSGYSISGTATVVGNQCNSYQL
jgi:hypothetical protein